MKIIQSLTKSLAAGALAALLCLTPALGAEFLTRDTTLLVDDELLLSAPEPSEDALAADDVTDVTDDAAEAGGVLNVTEGAAAAWAADPDGSVLTKSGGVNYYFDQKETYYNLNMDAVVATAHAQGIEGEYWIRDDGCKMLGDYIMIAANRDVHPQGSIVATSLGLGIVVDTGGFAASNPTQVDIAVNW